MPEEESFKEIKLTGEAATMIDYALTVDPISYKPEVIIRFGRPHQERGYFSIEDINNLIAELNEMKKELEKVI